MKLWPLFALLVLLGYQSATLAQPAIVDVGPSFPTGPYSSLYVDRNDPRRVAIGTMDGRIAWSIDGAQRVIESRVMSPRRYDAMAVRSGARASLGGADEDDDDGDDARDPTGATERPVRLFIKTLLNGKGVVRWQYWMAIADPLTDISAIFLPESKGRMLVAASAGILVSNNKGNSWTRTLGAPGTMPREKADLVGLSVIASPSDPSFVLAGTTEGVFMSRDGGMNFIPHLNDNIRDEMIFEFLWDPINPNVVLAVGPDTILQSEDGGVTFELAFVSEGEINTVVNADEGVYIAGSDGLTLVSADGNLKLIDGTSVIGVVPWNNGLALALMTDKLVLVDASGAQMELLRTTDTDMFFRLDGAPGFAYLLSSSALYRIGIPEARVVPKTVPMMALSGTATQQAMLDNLGLGRPEDVRIHTRWYSKLLPSIDFRLKAIQRTSDSIAVDYTLPLDFRFARAGSESSLEFFVMANWDLSNLVFGDQNVSNPDLFIESTLLANRDRLLMEVRSRYREAALIAHRLKNPPADPKTALLWRMRLEEHASYLEYLTGKEVVKEQKWDPKQ